jgi:hypothetical protein
LARSPPTVFHMSVLIRVAARHHSCLYFYLEIYDTYEIEVKTPYGFERSSAILSCEISPSSATSFVKIVGWLQKVNSRISQLRLEPQTKYNLLSNENLIIHNLTRSDDHRSYACIVKNQIDNDTRRSLFKSLRVRSNGFISDVLPLL